MDYATRVAAYQRQNGTCVLTARQMRRALHKENHYAALSARNVRKAVAMHRREAYRKFQADLTADIEGPTLKDQLTQFAEINDTLDDWATPDPVDVVNGTAVACPTCGVYEGSCKTKSGKRTKNHAGRE